MQKHASGAVNRDGGGGVPSLDIIRSILDRGDSDYMPGQKFQDPKIETRTDAKKPYYSIRPFVPVVTPEGIVRKQKRMHLGFCDEISMREAKARKEQIMATVNAGKFLVQSQLPFSAILNRFREVRLPQIGSATRSKYANHLDNHLEPAFKDLRMCDIDRPTAEVFLNGKAADGLAHWTLLDLRNLGSAIWNKAAEWKLFQGENPWQGLKVGGEVEVREKKIPKATELRAFITALPETRIATHEAAELMVLTAVSTGLRVSEILGLQPRDIDSEDRRLEVRRRWHRGDVAAPKTKASRRRHEILGLADMLLEFARGKADDAYIFGRADRDGNPPDDRDLQQHVFRPAAEAVKIYHPGFGMHDFRRVYITWRQHAGASSIEAQKGAGHARASTTWMYTIEDGERERQHVGWIQEQLGMDGPPPSGTVQ